MQEDIIRKQLSDGELTLDMAAHLLCDECGYSRAATRMILQEYTNYPIPVGHFGPELSAEEEARLDDIERNGDPRTPEFGVGH